MVCEHSGTHSGAIRYIRKDAQLRLVVVCDHCGAECAELGRLDYQPGWAEDVDGTRQAENAA
jgi:hypothetical protein